MKRMHVQILLIFLMIWVLPIGAFAQQEQQAQPDGSSSDMAQKPDAGKATDAQESKAVKSDAAQSSSESAEAPDEVPFVDRNGDGINDAMEHRFRRCKRRRKRGKKGKRGQMKGRGLKKQGNGMGVNGSNGQNGQGSEGSTNDGSSGQSSGN